MFAALCSHTKGLDLIKEAFETFAIDTFFFIILEYANSSRRKNNILLQGKKKVRDILI